MQLRSDALFLFVDNIIIYPYRIHWLEKGILLLQLAVAVHEAVYATSCVDELALACVEWVRSAGDFDLYHWVSLALKLYCVISLACRLAEEHVAVGHILEHYGTVVLWMNTFFHFLFFIY